MSSLGGAVRSGIEQGSTSESSLGAGQGVLQGCGTHRAESASPKVSNRAGKRPAEEKEAAPAPAVSRRRPPSPEGVLDPKNDSTGLDTDLFDERDWHGIKTELDEHSTIFAELLVTLQPDDPSTGRELARQAHRDLVHVALWGHQQRTQMQSTVEEMQKEAAEEKDLAAITQMDLESEVNELKSEVLSQSTIVQQVRKDLSLALGQVEIEPKNSAKRETKFIPPRCKNPNCSQSWLSGKRSYNGAKSASTSWKRRSAREVCPCYRNAREQPLRTGFRRSSTSR